MVLASVATAYFPQHLLLVDTKQNIPLPKKTSVNRSRLSIGTYRMSEQKKQRTIQVKIGNQAARAMTPDQAADYLKMIAGKGWGTSRELKMTFDNGSTSTVSLPHNGASSISTSSGGGGGAGSSSTDRPVLPRSDGLPCSEKEMKALMVRTVFAVYLWWALSFILCTSMYECIR